MVYAGKVSLALSWVKLIPLYSSISFKKVSVVLDTMVNCNISFLVEKLDDSTKTKYGETIYP